MQSYISETTIEESRRGAVLGMVLVVVVLVSLLGGGLMHYTSTVSAETGREVSKAQAFWAAEAGLQHLMAIGRGANEPLEDLGYNGEGVLEGTVLHSSYSVDVYPDPLEERLYHIVSQGDSAGNQQAVVEVNSELPTFSQYLMFSHLGITPDDQPIYFGDGDTIVGPIYANGEINIWHDHPNEILFGFPTPDGDDWLISSAAAAVNLHAGTLEVFDDDGSMYPDGQPQSRLRLNQPEVSTDPLVEFFTESRDLAQAGGLVIPPGDYDVTFHDDGTVVYEEHGGGSPVTNVISGFNGHIYLDGNAYVSGVLDGEVSFVVEHGIHITDDVQYESAQSPNPWADNFNSDSVGDDFLTLLTPEYVRIDANEGPGKKAEDRTVHASIYVTEDNALTGSEWYGFCAEQYDSNIGSPKLNLFGGVSQYRRGLLARPPNVTASGTAPQPFGYGKNFFFDKRMLGKNAPYTVYLVSGWEYR